MVENINSFDNKAVRSAFLGKNTRPAACFFYSHRVRDGRND
jgi:hypothetical protein